MIAGYYRSPMLTKGSHRAPHHVTQATTSEGLAQGPYVAARGGDKPATFCMEGTEHHHLTTTPLCSWWQCFR